jgi:hypothetical protein
MKGVFPIDDLINRGFFDVHAGTVAITSSADFLVHILARNLAFVKGGINIGIFGRIRGSKRPP